MMCMRASLFVSAIFATTLLHGAGSAIAQQVFPTPEAASQALVEAARNPGQGAIDKIFGPEGSRLLSSDDAEVDRERTEDFLALASRGTSVVDADAGGKVLVFGSDGWRFPIPLHSAPGGWTFDIVAGKQAITDRAIGRNEFTAMGACADYVDAQYEYFDSLHDDEPVQQFAQRLLSSPGKHDGLWWAPADATDISPLGDRIAETAVKTSRESGKPGSYQGYIYRILTQQGPSAPGGAYEYLAKGRLLAGFALIAYPEEWGKTGVMTFLCDQRGQVYERNLGPTTSQRAGAIKAFDPGAGWKAD
jgi:Protein of unknown function (DUF2950)